MLRRLLRMPIGEVADRSRQEASKWLERNGLARTELKPSAPPASGRFFAGCADDRTPALFARLEPEARDRVLAAAEGACLRRFDLLGYRGLCFGDPIDWRLDPVSGRRSPLVHWSLIDPTDAESVGDCKVVWELSRQQYLVTLGIAYRTTGDERYADAFASLVRAWMEENPPALGINWASSLEVSLRLIAWCWGLMLLRRSKRLMPQLLADLVAGISAHAAHVERYLSRHFSPNTHLTGEALGLFYAGVLFPENAAARRWRSLGRGILEQQLERQVLADGVHFEQSTCYQRYTVEIYLHYLALAARNGLAVPRSVGETVTRMLDVLLALCRPDGRMPAIGDADGGSLLPLVPRAPDDLRGVFAIAAALFARSDYAWAARGTRAEALWLLGPTASDSIGALQPAPPSEASRAFEAGGYVVMRSGFERDAHQLLFDVGPLGCPISGGHGHADLLSVQVCAFGEPYVVDPGTAVYAADPEWRDHFRGSAAHATVLVDGRGQARPAGPFAWRERPAALLERFQSAPDFDLAEAEHDAYARLRDPVEHRRQVVFVKDPGYWLIVDDLAGRAKHRVELRFPFAPALRVTSDSAGWIRARGKGARGLLLRAFSPAPLQVRIEDAWYAPSYGVREPAQASVHATAAELPLRVLTLLLPVEDCAAAPPPFGPLLLRAERILHSPCVESQA